MTTEPVNLDLAALSFQVPAALSAANRATDMTARALSSKDTFKTILFIFFLSVTCIRQGDFRLRPRGYLPRQLWEMQVRLRNGAEDMRVRARKQFVYPTGLCPRPC